jgi:hypothetical protein
VKRQQERLLRATMADKSFRFLHFVYPDSEVMITAKGYFNSNGINHKIINRSKKEYEYGAENVNALLEGDYIRMLLPETDTIVHERSHASTFTDDIAYGEDDCMALAKNFPAKTINNADSHEFFAKG